MSSAGTAKPGRPVLGRGLADLIPVGGNESGRTPRSSIAGTLGADKAPIGEEVPLTLLHPNPNQPRTRFDPQAISELASSIKANGILQPILVRPLPPPLPGYQIVAGERRYRAAHEAGLSKVPVIIRSLSDEDTLALALIENLIREDIGPLETARAYSRLMNDFGWTQEEMGKRVGKSRASVANALRLLKLPQEIQNALEEGYLSEGHARSLLGGDGSGDSSSEAFRARQAAVFERIIEEKLTVRDVERLMKIGVDAPSPPPTLVSITPTPNVSRETSPPTVPVSSVSRETLPVAQTPRLESLSNGDELERQALEDKLRSALGTKIRLVINADQTGRIEIGFFSADELESIASRLAG